MRQLRPHDKELLRAFADAGLLAEMQERTELKLFNQFKNTTDMHERLEIGKTCDALKAVTVEFQATINEAMRDERANRDTNAA